MVTKEDEKITNFSPLANEIRKMHQVLIKIVPLVVGCLGVMSSQLKGFLKYYYNKYSSSSCSGSHHSHPWWWWWK